MKQKYTLKKYKGSGLFNRCMGKNCAAKTPERNSTKKSRNNNITVNNPMMKTVVKRIENIINDSNNRTSNHIRKLDKTINLLKNSINSTKNKDVITLRKDQIKVLENMKEALIDKDTVILKNLQNNIERRIGKKK